MIRNGVIDAQREFAERRCRAEVGRNFDQIKIEVLDKHRVNIECCREVYFNAQETIFALVDNLLVETFSKPYRAESWDKYKKRQERPL